jgi:thiamine pyrophosphokinase
MKKVVGLLLTLGLAACGGGGGSGGVSGPQVDGYVFGAERASSSRQTSVAAQQALLAGATVTVYTLPATGAAVATTTADDSGHFIFSTAGGANLPSGKTLLLRATTSTRVVEGLVNTTYSVQSKSLSETTHLASLALLAGSATSFTDAQVALYETAARQALTSALASTPTADYTASSQQTAADLVATAAATLAAGGSLTAAAPPILSNINYSPPQLSSAGGTVNVSLALSDSQPASPTVTALVYAAGATVSSQTVALTLSSSQYTGSFALAANTGQSASLYEVALIADDGVAPLTPQAVNTVTVLPDGTVTLSIQAETLYNEPAGRRPSLDTLLKRMKPVLVRPGGRRPARQVNADQTITGVSVTVNTASGLSGVTDSSGAVNLSLPLSTVSGGLVEITGSFSGRVSYHQFLILGQGTTLEVGDTILVDLVLAYQTDWQTFSTSLALGGLDYTKAPIISVFNVTSGTSLGSTFRGHLQTPTATPRPIPSARSRRPCRPATWPATRPCCRRMNDGRAALILAAGEPPPAELLRARAAAAQWFVCCDGAAATALAAGVRPHTVLGDLDSLDDLTRADLAGVEIVEIAEQDTTDLEKALYTAVARGVREVLVLGAGGRRWDHFVANLSLLARYAERLALRAEDAWGRLTFAPAGVTVLIEAEPGDTVSLVALPLAEGVVTSGLRWPLAGERLAMGERDGVSNEVVAAPATLRYERGCLAVYAVQSQANSRRHWP